MRDRAPTKGLSLRAPVRQLIDRWADYLYFDTILIFAHLEIYQNSFYIHDISEIAYSPPSPDTTKHVAVFLINWAISHYWVGCSLPSIWLILTSTLRLGRAAVGPEEEQ